MEGGGRSVERERRISLEWVSPSYSSSELTTRYGKHLRHIVDLRAVNTLKDAMSAVGVS